VTGVQTCALPILERLRGERERERDSTDIDKPIDRWVWSVISQSFT